MVTITLFNVAVFLPLSSGAGAEIAYARLWLPKIIAATPAWQHWLYN